MTLDSIIQCVERELDDHEATSNKNELQLAIYETKKECYHDMRVVLSDILSALREIKKEQECGFKCTPTPPCDPRQ